MLSDGEPHCHKQEVSHDTLSTLVMVHLIIIYFINHFKFTFRSSKILLPLEYYHNPHNTPVTMLIVSQTLVQILEQVNDRYSRYGNGIAAVNNIRTCIRVNL